MILSEKDHALIRRLVDRQPPIFLSGHEGYYQHDDIVEVIQLVGRLQAAREEASQGAGEPVDLEALLKDPNAVHLNMLRGGIAKLTPAQIGHLYRGEEAEEVIREVRRQNPETQGAGEPVAWPISVDGPHKITDQRAWLARQLMDSKNSDEEAFGIVAYHPAIRGARPANDRTKALEEALETARDALQAAYQRTGHADDLAAAHIADAALLRTLETSNV